MYFVFPLLITEGLIICFLSNPQYRYGSSYTMFALVINKK